MQSKATIGALVLASGLLTAGCGGVDTSQDEQSSLSTREDALPSCDGQSYHRVYYSDSTYTTEIGGWYCFCGDNSAHIYGRLVGPYIQDLNIQDC
ncbi:hypothetical protein [Vitiosangium sp. GDMCC 1.1324]|uniref:hypothetical protein n=1 Tax=Vitiosangium sp. (strain GDMCC 1.1324) TaxID=2138576 RepID=UPI000D33BB45|nr:hypothetical protein [Vitiosangium sp. GDMCC 1.1324]PTL74954.1 hypothetical protein DAT35_57480 [Vitiosangium sp. GDMCC 1.1324]